MTAVHVQARTELSGSRTKLIIETRLPVVEPELTSPCPDAECHSVGYAGRHDVDASDESSDYVIVCADNDVKTSRKTGEKNLLPEIQNADGYRRRENISEMCVRGSNRRPRILPLPPTNRRPTVYRIPTGSTRIVRSANVHHDTRIRTALRRDGGNSACCAPLKQTYFVLQKPGVKVQDPSRTPKHIPPEVVLPARASCIPQADDSILREDRPEMDTLTISFRDSDSPDPRRIYGCKGHDLLFSSGSGMRARSASIPTNARIGGCVTGTSKMLHSRSEARIT